MHQQQELISKQPLWAPFLEVSRNGNNWHPCGNCQTVKFPVTLTNITAVTSNVEKERFKIKFNGIPSGYLCKYEMSAFFGKPTKFRQCFSKKFFHSQDALNTVWQMCALQESSSNF